jgi:hypothetical protein
MTADSYPFKHAFPARTATRIIKKVKEINRMCYGVTGKPPGDDCVGVRDDHCWEIRPLIDQGN